MKVLVLGAGGRLAKRVMAALTPEHDVVGVPRQALDITDATAVRNELTLCAPKAVINCAAWTAMDAAERYSREAFDINARAVRTLVRECDRVKALFVHYSTALVFDGMAKRPYTETDEPTPHGIYAWSKWAGERMAIGEPHARPRAVYVVRLGQPEYGQVVTGILDAMRMGNPTSIVPDAQISLSFSADVAVGTARLLTKRPPYGVYHMTNRGSCSWRGFSIEAANYLQVEPELKHVAHDDSPTMAPRPRYSVLSCDKLNTVGIELPSWRESLRRDVVGALA